MMSDYKVIIENPDSTVVSSYERTRPRRTAFQSEAELEKALINQLIEQGYERLTINSHQGLINNLKKQLEKLNDYKFSNEEWKQILEKYLINPKESIAEKTFKVQEDYKYSLVRDDGTTQNINIIDKENIHNNSLQVINQIAVEGKSKNIYDVTILVNGLPLVHIELKRRGSSIREAFNQIRRYQEESFWAETGLYEYVQVFVISNGTQTKYYSNTTRDYATKENRDIRSNRRKTSHSFEFTSFWADAKNKTIEDLEDFTATFFAKHTLLNVIAKYCVFTSEKLLLVMRPYQIAATEKIINEININLNNKQRIGTIEAGGYVWHTTGSGKTLTSFKASQIASKLPGISKVLFVVDRRDLDYQTMKEYDNFKKGAANSNVSTRVLQSQLESSDDKILITTIQKLSRFIRMNKGHKVFNENVVIIFDECHRSQFGEMHRDIIRSFKKYMIFGFTGTPIFAVNASGNTSGTPLRTTQQVFGKQLHTYTIIDAIQDGNVLPFRIDYINTTRAGEFIEDDKVEDILREEALLAPERISLITKYILEKFSKKTKRQEQSYDYNRLLNIEEVAKRLGRVKEERQRVKLTGFNSIFAVASIEAAKRYYAEFKRQQEDIVPDQRLKVAIIYSWNPNESSEFSDDGLFDENNEDTSGLDASSKEFLNDAIKDYNEMFSTNYDVSSDKFQNYYKDVSLRVKNREVDLLIVVNMFLTGFDATTLNTLWVDKKLKAHGLIQAFSRTNRILNSVKRFGNIVCFRNLEEQVKKAVALFGNEDAAGIIVLRSFKEYYDGYEDFPGYVNFIEKLKKEYPLGKAIVGEKAEKEFVRLFNSILRVKNILQAFDEFSGQEIISDYDYQDYHSIYIGIYEKYSDKGKSEAVNIIGDLEFEIELVKSVEVNIDYILALVEKYFETNTSDTEIIAKVSKAVDASPTLRNKKDLIINFVNTVNLHDDFIKAWLEYIEEMKKKELQKIIDEENLKPAETKKFMAQVFDSGEIKAVGTDITRILPATSMFGATDGITREERKQRVFEKLSALFERFFGL